MNTTQLWIAIRREYRGVIESVLVENKDDIGPIAAYCLGREKAEADYKIKQMLERYDVKERTDANKSDGERRRDDNK